MRVRVHGQGWARLRSRPFRDGPGGPFDRHCRLSILTPSFCVARFPGDMLRSVRPRRVTVCCCCCGRTPSAGARGRRAYALPPPPTTAPPSSVSTSSESPSTLLPPPASLPGSSRQPRKTPDAAPDFGSRPSPFLAKDAVRPAIGVSPTIAPSAARLPWSKRQSDASPSVASALPHSSFDKLFSRTLEYLDNPDLAQPDPHAAHSEVGRAFVGELRDIDGNVVEGRQLANLALRLGVIGVIKREMGAIEKISFLPVRVLGCRSVCRSLLADLPYVPPFRIRTRLRASCSLKTASA